MNSHKANIFGISLCLILLVTFLFITTENVDIYDETPTGNTVAFVEILPSDDYNCSDNYTSGWHIIAIPCLLGSPTPTTLFENASGVTKLYRYTGGSDTWDVWVKGLPSWVVFDLDTVSRQYGYYMYANANTSFYYDGQIVNTTNLSLSTGWSLIPYVSRTTSPIATAFTSVSGSYTIIRTLYNSSSLTIASHPFYDPNNIPGSTIINAIPMRGYWINMTTADILEMTK